MRATLKAILARCDGDTAKARDYCESVASSYPHLRDEYYGLAILFGMESKAEAAHA